MNSERIYSHRNWLPWPSRIKSDESTPSESAVALKSLQSRTVLSLVRHMSGAAFGTGLRRDRELSRIPARTHNVWASRAERLENMFLLFTNQGVNKSMRQMIGKSIDQSMTIDALLVNWHRPIDDQSIITQKWSHFIDWHKKISVSHVPACTYTQSQYAQMFEIWIRSPDCLYAVAWVQKSTTETYGTPYPPYDIYFHYLWRFFIICGGYIIIRGDLP